MISRTTNPLIRLLLVALFSTPAVVAAQCTITSGSTVFALDAKTYYIGVAATLPATGTTEDCSFSFSLPAPDAVIAFQGTQGVRATCGASVLSSIRVNAGQKFYPSILRTPNRGGQDNIFEKYTIPLAYTNGSASIQVESIVPTGCSSAVFEVQGVLKLQ